MTLHLAYSGVQLRGLVLAPVGVLAAAYCWRRGVPVTQNYRLTGASAKFVAILIVLITVAAVLAVVFTPQIERFVDEYDAKAR